MNQAPVSETSRTDLQPSTGRLRTYSLLIYGLYLAAFVNGLTAFVAVFLAYYKRGDARGTVYESHLRNATKIFWVTVVVGLIGLVLHLVLIGWFVWLILGVWVLWRCLKGILRAIDERAYD